MITFLSINATLFQWIVLPILIMLARILDVSIGTIRIILVARGYKLLAPVLGFFEVIIWLIAISQVMQHLKNVMCYLAYGTGFALGNYVGILMESKLAMGLQAIRVITQTELHSFPMVLRDEGFGVTTLDAYGSRGPVNIFFTIVPRKDVPRVLDLVKIFAPDSFVTVEDIRSSYAGIFPTQLDTPVYKRLMKKK